MFISLHNSPGLTNLHIIYILLLTPTTAKTTERAPKSPFYRPYQRWVIKAMVLLNRYAGMGGEQEPFTQLRTPVQGTGTNKA